MTSKRRMTSTDDIDLLVVVKLCVGLKLSPLYTDTELVIDLLDFSLLPHLPHNPDIAPLGLSLFPDQKKELRAQRFETSLELRNKAHRVIFSFSEDWFKVTLDQWVYRHDQKCLATGGDDVEKVNRTLDFRV